MRSSRSSSCAGNLVSSQKLRLWQKADVHLEKAICRRPETRSLLKSKAAPLMDVQTKAPTWQRRVGGATSPPPSTAAAVPGSTGPPHPQPAPRSVGEPHALLGTAHEGDFSPAELGDSGTQPCPDTPIARAVQDAALGCESPLPDLPAYGEITACSWEGRRERRTVQEEGCTLLLAQKYASSCFSSSSSLYHSRRCSATGNPSIASPLQNEPPKLQPRARRTSAGHPARQRRSSHQPLINRHR